MVIHIGTEFFCKLCCVTRSVRDWFEGKSTPKTSDHNRTIKRVNFFSSGNWCPSTCTEVVQRRWRIETRWHTQNNFRTGRHVLFGYLYLWSYELHGNCFQFSIPSWIRRYVQYVIVYANCLMQWRTNRSFSSNHVYLILDLILTWFNRKSSLNQVHFWIK